MIYKLIIESNKSFLNKRDFNISKTFALRIIKR